MTGLDTHAATSRHHSAYQPVPHVHPPRRSARSRHRVTVRPLRLRVTGESVSAFVLTVQAFALMATGATTGAVLSVAIALYCGRRAAQETNR